MSDTSDAASDELSYPQALQRAMDWHRQGEHERALRLYMVLCQAVPDDPNPKHYLGVLLHQLGRRQEGLSLIQAAIELDGEVAAWHNNHGNVLLDLGRHDDAAAAYARCSALDPDNVEVLNNLGVMLRGLQRFDEAEAVLLRAIERNPRFANAHSNLAALCFLRGRAQAGFEHCAQALALQPDHPKTRRLLGMVYAKLGRFEEAARIYHDWLEQEPGNPQALHYLAACGASPMPERAGDDYVQKVFDDFAGSFEAKLQVLDYQAPSLIGAVVDRLLGTPAGQAHILDAGCGTGLCGPHLAPHAARLVGVDLSAGMLDKARSRQLYTELVKAELVADLEGRPDSLHLVVSADTLCYFGRLDTALAAAARALKAGGHLVFTVESHTQADDYVLHPHGRYSHSGPYVEACLAGAGFARWQLDKVVLRTEGGEPVSGWLVSATRSGHAC
jgi:predicted TPR repeat methyltransferase